MGRPTFSEFGYMGGVEGAIEPGELKTEGIPTSRLKWSRKGRWMSPIFKAR
jgi:hypothetical protein